jgi:putative ABC transport system ATP-binding protein
VEALRGLNFSLQPGEFVSVMGPSGSGKSTLLHLIGGLDTPTSGRICLGGDALDTLDDDRLTILRRQKIGFIFQAFNLLDVLTAEENVAVPLVVDGLAETEAQRRAVEALKLVGMDHRRHHRPGQLSGGEQQRIAIARALVTRPLLLLADEPTGNLDSANSEHVMTLLRRLATEGQTILMVTHNAQHAAQADRLVRLRDGVIVEEQRLAANRSVETVLADLEALP